MSVDRSTAPAVLRRSAAGQAVGAFFPIAGKKQRSSLLQRWQDLLVVRKYVTPDSLFSRSGWKDCTTAVFSWKSRNKIFLVSFCFLSKGKWYTLKFQANKATLRCFMAVVLESSFHLSMLSPLQKQTKSKKLLLAIFSFFSISWYSGITESRKIKISSKSTLFVKIACFRSGLNDWFKSNRCRYGKK